MIPAICAAASASPLGSSRSCVAVSGAILTVARATARRRDTGLPPTSTMWMSPVEATWLSSPTPLILAARSHSDAVERGQLGLDPGAEVVLPHVCADRLDPRAPLLRRHLETLVNRFCLTGKVERINGQRPLSELGVSACVLGEDEHPVAFVYERTLLGDEIQAVVDRIHEQDVILLVGGDRLWEVVPDLQVDRRPAVLLEPVVDGPGGALDRAEVFGVVGNVLPRGIEQRQHPHSAARLGVRVEVRRERL